MFLFYFELQIVVVDYSSEMHFEETLILCADRMFSFSVTLNWFSFSFNDRISSSFTLSFSSISLNLAFAMIFSCSIFYDFYSILRMFFYLWKLIKCVLFLDLYYFVYVLFVLLEKGFHNIQCILCTIAFDLIDNLLKVIVTSSWGFQDRMSCTFTGNLFWCTSFYTTELLGYTVIKIFIIAEAFYGRGSIFRQVQPSRKIETL